MICDCSTALWPAAKAFGEAYTEQFASHLENIPLGPMGDPEQDIGRAVVALVSDDMAYVTGSTIMLNDRRVVL